MLELIASLGAVLGVAVVVLAAGGLFDE